MESYTDTAAESRPLSAIGESGEASTHIRDLVRQTGLRREQLYMWERRYGFPQPLRAQNGDRIYPADQVEKLSLLQQLLKKGWRAGSIVPLELEELREIWATTQKGGSHTDPSPEQNLVVNLLAQHRVGELQVHLSKWLMDQGLRGFLFDTLVPLNESVHDLNVRGELRAFQQFRYSEMVQRLLRDATRFIRPQRDSKHVLLAMPPSDKDALGLAMVEAVLLMEGVYCPSLGAGVPLPEIADAAKAYNVAAVGLVFDNCNSAKVATHEIRALREVLAEQYGLWVVGRAVHFVSKAMPGALLATDVRSLVEELREQGIINGAHR